MTFLKLMIYLYIRMKIYVQIFGIVKKNIYLCIIFDMFISNDILRY